eukprot:COSAG05_NODE_2284_length_3284_cov_22.607535_2_plen_120_part_00
MCESAADLHRGVRYIDGYDASIVGSHVQVKWHNRLECVAPDELLPRQGTEAGTAHNSSASAASTVTIRGTAFVAPAATEKIITALYGWDWRTPDAMKRGGGDRPEEKGNVCRWPSRPPE